MYYKYAYSLLKYCADSKLKTHNISIKQQYTKEKKDR